MDEDVFCKTYGTRPLVKKRIKRERFDEFDEFEQNMVIKDDPFDIYSFGNESVLNGYQPIEDSMIMPTQTQSCFDLDRLHTDYEKRMNIEESSCDNLSPHFNDDTTQSYDYTDDIVVEHSGNLLDIQEKLNSVMESTQTLESHLKELFHNHDIEHLDNILESLFSHLSDLQNFKDFLKRNFTTQYLMPQDIELTSSIENTIVYIQYKINMIINEIKHVQNPEGNQELPACLNITSQPFPKSAKQNKPLKEGIVVNLITGSSYICKPLSDVKADVITNFQSKSKDQSLIKNNTATMSNNEAVFNNIIFPSGTRKRTILLKFSVDVEIYHPFTNKKNVFHIESASTRPIIVKTNENQWEESEGILLKDETFRDQKTVSWFQFSNTLQRRYLLATKQNLLYPIRPLTLDDFDYIFKAKFNKGDLKNANVDVQVFDSFWHWFGPGLHKIRYQRHLCNLWVNGYVCGYVPRSEAESILKDFSSGTFLIRLSERMNGTFTVAYTILENNTKKICHYIISSDDVFGAKKTLPDFLGNEFTLTHLVKVSITGENKKKYDIVSKDEVLGEYYSRRPSEMETDGYDRKIIRTVH